jgi:hypothetical protein
MLFLVSQSYLPVLTLSIARPFQGEHLEVAGPTEPVEVSGRNKEYESAKARSGYRQMVPAAARGRVLAGRTTSGWEFYGRQDAVVHWKTYDDLRFSPR